MSLKLFFNPPILAQQITIMKNIYLEQLEKLFIDFYSTKYSKQKESDYEAVCRFCIETKLVTPQEIRSMQDEVIKNFC
jgi:hypothetical protein